MFALVLNLSLKVYIFVLAGAVLGLFAGKGEKVSARLVDFAFYGLIPVYLLLSLWGCNVPFTGAVWVAATALVVMAGGFLFAWLWAKARGIQFRDQALPIIMMNSAYLALPVSQAVGGQEAFNYALVYNVVATVLNFTVGMFSVSRTGKLSEMLEIPIIYAVAGGLLLNVLGISMPSILCRTNNALSIIVLPAMLVLVGYKVARIKLHSFRLAVYGVILRMGGGFAVALVCVKLMGLTGAAALICLLSSSMPSAVNNYIMAEQFKLDADFAAATIVIGTFASFFTVPLIYMLFK